MRRWICVAMGLLMVACGEKAPPAAGPQIRLSEDSIKMHLMAFSSDDMMGRGTGEWGGDQAAAYIAERFEVYELDPVNGTYFQSVPMVGYTTDPSTVELSFSGPQGQLEAPYLDGFVLKAGDPEATSASGSAEVVFVGYGINAPEAEWNDFADVNVRGKFLLILVNDPPAPPDEPDLFGGPAMTYYGRWTYKWEEAARQGALGALIVHETGPAGYPWSVVRVGNSGEQFALRKAPNAPPTAGMVGWVTQEIASNLLALNGLSFDSLKTAAGQRGFTAVPTGVRATASLTATQRPAESRNVIGVVPGKTAPTEFVIVTSHYDAFGTGEPVDGDSIYNGAYDNASGVALMLEMARALVTLPVAERPARSVLFMATGAEEHGLLGATWYTRAPLFWPYNTVAEVNLDGANLWGETDDVTILGEERSGLGAFARARATEAQLTIVPDPEPEVGSFFRSDHFPFAKLGIPAIYIKHGLDYRDRPEGWGQQFMDEYTAQHYHAPSDEFSEEFTYDGVIQQGLLTWRVVYDIAQDSTWPNWNEGQEFKAARDSMMHVKDSIRAARDTTAAAGGSL